jgi:hypothetical protein
MTFNTTIADVAKILLGFIWDIIYFPFWWYSAGLWAVLKWVGNFLLRRLQSTGLIVWVVNLFTPMYGQRDIAGKLISFFMRLIQIVFRSVVMFFWLVFSVAIIIFWLILPVFILYELILQLSL